jgi:hypothetical protein
MPSPNQTYIYATRGNVRKSDNTGKNLIEAHKAIKNHCTTYKQNNASILNQAIVIQILDQTSIPWM